jgi:hypothetical protein
MSNTLERTVVVVYFTLTETVWSTPIIFLYLENGVLCSRQNLHRKQERVQI